VLSANDRHWGALKQTQWSNVDQTSGQPDANLLLQGGFEHRMHDHRQLASQRYGRSPEAKPFFKLQRSGAQGAGTGDRFRMTATASYRSPLIASARDMAVMIDLARPVTPWRQAHGEREFLKFAGSSTAAAKAVAVSVPTPGTDMSSRQAGRYAPRGQLLAQLCCLVSDITPGPKHWHDDPRQLFLALKKVANVAPEHAAGAFGHDEAERLPQAMHSRTQDTALSDRGATLQAR